MSSSGVREIEDLVNEALQLPHSLQKRQLLDRALILTHELGEELLEFDVRYHITSCAAHTGDTDAQLSNFAWCLAKYDEDPLVFGSQTTATNRNLLWQFKWMISPLDSSPVFSLAQSEAMLDDMEDHYRRANLGMSGVVMERYAHAWSVGDMDKARLLRAEHLATPRDSHSDCIACVQSTLARFAVSNDEEDLALTLLDEILEKNMTCLDEPGNVLAHTAITQLRAGRLEGGLDAHLTSYRKARDNPDRIGTITEALKFCAVTGNEARGLNILERHLPWLVHDQLNEKAQMSMLGACGVLLDAVTRAGYGEQVIRGTENPVLEQFFGGHVGPWMATELAEACWSAAHKLGEAFNARNGNTSASDGLAATKALLDEHYDLPIKTHTFLIPSTPAEPTSPQEWLDYAEVLVYAGLYSESREAALKALDGEAKLKTFALSLAIGASLKLEDDHSAHTWMSLRQEIMIANNRLEEAQSEERLGLDLYRSTPESIPALKAEIERLEAGGAGFALGTVLRSLGNTYLTCGESEEEYRLALQYFEASRELVHPEILANLLWGMVATHVRLDENLTALEICEQIQELELTVGDKAALYSGFAALLADQGRYTQAIQYADEVLRIYSMYGVNTAVVSKASLAASLYHDMQRFDDELTRLRTGLQAAVNAELPTRELRCRIGTALANSGHGKEAVEYLWEALGEAENDTPAEKAAICGPLGWAFEVANEPGRAVNTYRTAAAYWAEADRPFAAAENYCRQANVLRWFNAHKEACQSYDMALEALEDNDNICCIQVDILHGRGLSKSQIEDSGAIEDIDLALALSTDHQSPAEINNLLEAKAQILGNLDHDDEAVALFLQASDKYDDLGDHDGAARNEHFAALTLVKSGKSESGVDLWHQARKREITNLNLRRSILVKLAETLDSLGRDSQAAEIRGLLNE
ncbi:MAG: hypothetical protein LBG99_07645 [Propionibacteriaceae bacterium]|nr:hypothetical protein [Propionibacteriaceae bacterium]